MVEGWGAGGRVRISIEPVMSHARMRIEHPRYGGDYSEGAMLDIC